MALRFSPVTLLGVSLQSSRRQTVAISRKIRIVQELDLTHIQSRAVASRVCP
jgi:hypothetical protein